MIEAHRIRHLIESALPDAQVTVRDLTGGADAYEVEVVSERFIGVVPLQRHRMVYAPLKEVLGGDLHAISLRTLTPDEA